MIVTHQYLPYSKLGLYSPWLFRSRSNEETNICEFGAFALICNTIHLYSSPTRFNYLADFKIGWDQRRLRCWTNTHYNLASNIILRMWWWDMKIHAHMATWLSKSTWVREVWNLVHCQSKKITMPKFWGEISLWILNKHLRTHPSKIEMKVYWLNCHKKKHYEFLKVCRKK